jgi:glycosyltransferase involved in cell wall biosynthesis
LGVPAVKVWVVKTSEMLPADNDSDRLLRSGLTARMLDARGHEVTWWMSTFDHANRRQRARRDVVVPFGVRGSIRMLRSPGYKSSTSLARLLDHFLWGRRFARVIETEPPPDVIFCAYPTIESASVATRYGRRRGVPVVLDLRDMWPDILLELAPARLRGIARGALAPIFSQARAAMAHATALFAITPEFLEWGLRCARRQRNAWDAAFPLAYPSALSALNSDATDAAAEQIWDEFGVTSSGSFNVVVVASMTNRRFEMEAVIEAARVLQKDERPVRFVLAGAGDDLHRYQALAAGCANVVFPGWINSSQIRVLLGRSHVGLIPYRNTPDLLISVPNKVAEYLSASLPVVTSLRGTLPRVLMENHCGLAYDAAQPASLIEVLRKLRDQDALRAQLAANARMLFERDFEAESVYGRMIDRLVAIAGVPEAVASAPLQIAPDSANHAPQPSAHL